MNIYPRDTKFNVNLSSDWEIFSPIFPEIIMIHLDIYGFNFLNTGECVGHEGVFIA